MLGMLLALALSVVSWYGTHRLWRLLQQTALSFARRTAACIGLAGTFLSGFYFLIAASGLAPTPVGIALLYIWAGAVAVVLAGIVVRWLPE